MSVIERAASMVAATQPAENGVLRDTHTGPAGADAAGGDLFAAMEDETAAFDGSTLAPPVKRSAGRPKGSPNRTTLHLQQFLLARGYRDPAEMLAAVASADPRALAAALAGHNDPKRVTFDQAVEVTKLVMRAGTDLLPYFHQRLPQQAEAKPDDMAGRPLIIIHGAGSVSLGGAEGQAKQNQGLSAGVIDVSDMVVSDGGENA